VRRSKGATVVFLGEDERSGDDTGEGVNESMLRRGVEEWCVS
jgi:hypothetical protein